MAETTVKCLNVKYEKLSGYLFEIHSANRLIILAY